MNQELQKQLAAMLAKLMDVAQDASAWAGQQIPPLVQEKILFGRIEHTALAVLLSVIAWRAAVYSQRFYRQASATAGDRRYDVWPERPGGVAFIVCALVGLASATVALIHLDWAVMAWLTPRLFIVEWLRSLING